MKPKYNYILRESLKVDKVLSDFIEEDLLPKSNVDKIYFWKELDKRIYNLTKKNDSLLRKRKDFQNKIDDWFIKRKDIKFSFDEYFSFLKEIGYVINEKEDFVINTKNVDDEISNIAGPQLVVPVNNARYAINAANARWGSLYDALYGSDIIPEENGCEKGNTYNPKRGNNVINYTRKILDKSCPIKNLSWSEIEKFSINDGNLNIISENKYFELSNPKQFVGYVNEQNNLRKILLIKNNLHIEILINPYGKIGSNDKANIDDIILESAVTTIMDCEDSIAAVDGNDKVLAYKNWQKLVNGELEFKMIKNEKNFVRKLNSNKEFLTPHGKKYTISGRSLMLIRNVGHLMKNPAILLSDDTEIPEGILDAFITVLAVIPDLELKNNSKNNSIYIVKPKMHGPEEVEFACEIFANVEDVFGLSRNTIKIGIMDEERRTTVNLKECIRAAKSRVVFINTGFLDRTGDEIHTSMHAGPMIRKNEMKKSSWIKAYENWNVDVGLACGFSGIAQIGKGMWAMPDKMDEMMKQKIDHPLSGANCAWVPSPTAATLHALHYHEVNVFEKQAELVGKKRGNLNDILSIPITKNANWANDEINNELENNIQGILGYVVRWVDQGIGCSKVPDINDVGLMEDRATLRISSQHIANWLHHGICTKDHVIEILKKMALKVDEQNKNDVNYERMSDNFEISFAFKAAYELIFNGLNEPSGYTEPILHKMRIQKKINLGNYNQ